MDGKCECFPFFLFLDLQYVFLVSLYVHKRVKTLVNHIIIVLFMHSQQIFFLFYALVCHLKFYAEVISGGRPIFYLHLNGYSLV